MAEPTLKFNNVKSILNKNSKGTSTYQTKKYPSAYILYTTLAELPESLADNALIFTTDTAELFVGTGSGIQRIKLGTEADLNPRLYLKILEAKSIYQRKIDAETDKSDLNNAIVAAKNELTESIRQLEGSVYTKEEIDNLLMEDIDLDGIIDKVNSYTVKKINDLLAEKAASVDVYTQDQVNELIAKTKQEASDANDTLKAEVAETYATIIDAATKTELSDKEIEIKDLITEKDVDVRSFVTDNYFNKETVTNTYATIEQVNELSSNVDNKFEATNESIANNTSEIDNVKANYVKTSSYTSDKELLEASIDNVDSALTSFKDEVYKKEDVFNKTEINDKVSTLNSSIDSLKETKVNKDTYEETLGNIDNNFNDVQENIRLLANKVYTKGEVDNKVSNAVNSLETQLGEKTNTINNEVSGIKEDVETLKSNAITEDIMTAAITTAVESKADKIDLTSANNSISYLGERVTTLENKEVYTKAEVDAAIESAIASALQQIRGEFGA